jgi:ABC-type transport system involved in multi-copper enzyme maturation permease subunit
MKNTFRIAFVAVRELLHERVVYLLLGFAIAALAVSILLGQLTYVEHAQLTLDFLLAGQHLTMCGFAVFVGIALFQRELASGSVAMVLSKPVARSSFLLGKYLGQLVVQSVVIAGMGLVVFAASSVLGKAPVVAIAQATLMTALECAVLAGAAFFFAVNAGALTAALGCVAIFIAGHFRVSTVTGNSLTDSATKILLRGLFPDLEVFNVRLLASYGLGLSTESLLIAVAYGALASAFFVALACLCFEHRDVQT